MGLVDSGKDRLGDGVEDPVGDAGICQLPLGVAIGRRGGRVNVRRKPELAEDGVKEAPPLRVVALVEIEGHGDMGVNVDGLENSSGGRCRRIVIEVEGAIGVEGRGFRNSSPITDTMKEGK